MYIKSIFNGIFIYPCSQTSCNQKSGSVYLQLMTLKKKKSNISNSSHRRHHIYFLQKNKPFLNIVQAIF